MKRKGRRACVVCKGSHAACDRGYPCSRCISLGRTSECKESPSSIPSRNLPRPNQEDGVADGKNSNNSNNNNGQGSWGKKQARKGEPFIMPSGLFPSPLFPAGIPAMMPALFAAHLPFITPRPLQQQQPDTNKNGSSSAAPSNDFQPGTAFPKPQAMPNHPNSTASVAAAVAAAAAASAFAVPVMPRGMGVGGVGVGVGMGGAGGGHPLVQPTGRVSPAATVGSGGGQAHQTQGMAKKQKKNKEMKMKKKQKKEQKTNGFPALHTRERLQQMSKITFPSSHNTVLPPPLTEEDEECEEKCNGMRAKRNGRRQTQRFQSASTITIPNPSASTPSTIQPPVQQQQQQQSASSMMTNDDVAQSPSTTAASQPSPEAFGSIPSTLPALISALSASLTSAAAVDSLSVALTAVHNNDPQKMDGLLRLLLCEIRDLKETTRMLRSDGEGLRQKVTDLQQQLQQQQQQQAISAASNYSSSLSNPYNNPSTPSSALAVPFSPLAELAAAMGVSAASVTSSASPQFTFPQLLDYAPQSMVEGTYYSGFSSTYLSNKIEALHSYHAFPDLSEESAIPFVIDSERKPFGIFRKLPLPDERLAICVLANEHMARRFRCEMSDLVGCSIRSFMDIETLLEHRNSIINFKVQLHNTADRPRRCTPHLAVFFRKLRSRDGSYFWARGRQQFFFDSDTMEPTWSIVCLDECGDVPNAGASITFPVSPGNFPSSSSSSSSTTTPSELVSPSTTLSDSTSSGSGGLTPCFDAAAGASPNDLISNLYASGSIGSPGTTMFSTPPSSTTFERQQSSAGSTMYSCGIVNGDVAGNDTTTRHGNGVDGDNPSTCQMSGVTGGGGGGGIGWESDGDRGTSTASLMAGASPSYFASSERDPVFL